MGGVLQKERKEGGVVCILLKHTTDKSFIKGEESWVF